VVTAKNPTIIHTVQLSVTQRTQPNSESTQTYELQQIMKQNHYGTKTKRHERKLISLFRG